MNFFERQQQVRRLSFRLVLLFALAVVGIIATINLAVLIAFGGFEGRPVGDLIGIMVATTVITGAVIGLASLFRTISLRGGGGGKVARSLGATPVPANTSDPQLRRLRNVVEEVAIASGVPVPELYVMEGEPGINAFAAGWSTSDAAVAVTRGALDRLNRDELQGVIAHEFSHVVNGDMRLNIKLMGLLFGILILAMAGRTMLYAGGRGRNRNGGPIILVALALVVAGFVGVFIGRMIKAAVSRQREYLADASAVQFTRQTAGLTGALKKIAGLPSGSNLNNAKAEDVSHMLFGSGKGFSGMFATHPPILKRIQVLDPSISRQQLDELARRWSHAPPSGLQEDRAMGLAGGGESLPAAGSAVTTAPDRVTAQVGAPAPGAYRRAGTILEQIPEQFRDRAHDPDTVVPLVLGLLFSEHPQVRTAQHGVLTARHGRELADAAWQEGGALQALHPMLRLPLAEVAFPALRERPRPEQDAVMGTVYAMVQADGRLSVSEYCLSRLLYEELYEATHREPQWGKKRYSLAASRNAAATLLATLAEAGHTEAGAAERAFTAGVTEIFPGAPLPYQPPPQGVSALESVWPALDGLNPADKELLVRSMVAVISHDGEMTVTELELLRTICALLHCPLPPIADAVTPD